MKNRKGTSGKLICLALCAALAVILLTACSGSANIKGTWNFDKAEHAGSAQSDLGHSLYELQDLGGTASLTFGENGQGELSVNVWGFGDSKPFSYSVRGNQLILEGSNLTYSSAEIR